MLNKLPQSVRIFEVGPRDGLQNEHQTITTEDKFAFIKMLAEAGIKDIELTSFVRPDAIPQLNDGHALVTRVLNNKFSNNLRLSCLVPNQKGMENAIAAGAKEVAIFTATSETFSKRNTNASIAETLDRFTSVTEMAKENNIAVRGYLSTVFGCPYEGNIDKQKVLELTKKLFDLGVYEVSLGDTIGIGTPKQIEEILSLILDNFPADKIALHLHDTRGLAIANILLSLDMGITVFDSSAGGLGGCPYAKGASGNVATEDLVYLFDSIGIETGIDLEKLIEASTFMLNRVGKQSPSKVYQAIISGKE